MFGPSADWQNIVDDELSSDRSLLSVFPRIRVLFVRSGEFATSCFSRAFLSRTVKFRRAGAIAIRKPKNFKRVFIRFVIHLVFRVFHHLKTHGRLWYSLGINAFIDFNVNVASLIQSHFFRFSRKPSYWHNRVYACTHRCVRFRIYPEIISTLHRHHSPSIHIAVLLPDDNGGPRRCSVMRLRA